MHRLNLLEAGRINKLPDGYGINNPCCREAYDAYAANVATVNGFAVAPGWTYWTAKTWLESCTEAQRQVMQGKHKKKRLGAIRGTSHLPTIARIAGLSEELMANAMNISRDKQIEHFVELTATFERFVMCSPYLHGVFENLLKSLVVHAWIAIETLYGDLFKRTVNAKANSGKFSHLSAAKAAFKTRKWIDHWYTEAFKGDKSIMDLVKHEDIRALGEVRHVLTHGAGTVDPSFYKAVHGDPKANPPVDANGRLSRFSGLDLTDEIEFDGTLVFEFVDPAFKRGYDLIVAVDKWL